MTEPAMMSSQECKRQALLLMSQLQGRQMDAREAQISLAGAQVWATLATVPEPLETLTATAELVSAPTLGAQFPTLTCPHGTRAHLLPQSSEEVDEVSFPTNLKYVFVDCVQCGHG